MKSRNNKKIVAEKGGAKSRVDGDPVLRTVGERVRRDGKQSCGTGEW